MYMTYNINIITYNVHILLYYHVAVCHRLSLLMYIVYTGIYSYTHLYTHEQMYSHILCYVDLLNCFPYENAHNIVSMCIYNVMYIHVHVTELEHT